LSFRRKPESRMMKRRNSCPDNYGLIGNLADAFCAQRPYFRATSLLFRRNGNSESKGGQGTILSCREYKDHVRKELIRTRREEGMIRFFYPSATPNNKLSLVRSL
jgi:hypothetical protein